MPDRNNEVVRAELVRRVGEWRDSPPAALAYAGPADFVLQHGDWRRPTRVSRGVPQHCYGNAIGYAVAEGWTYVEGFAWVPTPTSTTLVTGFVLQHAWCLDRDGEPVEVTWPSPGRAYCGVAFSVQRADDCTWNGDATVLDDYQRGWPLLRERWRGETTNDAPWTNRLLAMQTAVRVGINAGRFG